MKTQKKVDLTLSNAKTISSETKAEDTIKKIKVSQIKKKRNIFVRERLNLDAIERYKILYELGKTKPFVVQKGTNILLDGWHRLEAVKALGIAEVEIIEKDIPDSELLAESYRLNKGHGVPLNRTERNMMIVRLRFEENRTLEYIAKIVDMSISGVKRVCDDFSNFSPKKSKVDLRKKADSKEIIKAYSEGVKQKEIAGRFQISEGRVSQVIGQFGKWREKGKVNMLRYFGAFRALFATALCDGLFETSKLEFRKEGVFAKKYDHRHGTAVFAFFSKYWFAWYEVKEEIDVLCPYWLFKLFSARWMKESSFSSENKVTGGYPMGVSFTEGWVHMTSTRQEFQKRLSPVGHEPFPQKIEIDEKGFVKGLDMKIQVKPHDLTGIGTEDTFVQLRLKDGKLKVDCMMEHEWSASKVITPLKIEGEAFRVSRGVNSKPFSKALKICRWAIAPGPTMLSGSVWISFFRHNPTTIITALPHEIALSRAEHLSQYDPIYHAPWFIHYVIGGKEV